MKGGLLEGGEGNTEGEHDGREDGEVVGGVEGAPPHVLEEEEEEGRQDDEAVREGQGPQIAETGNLPQEKEEGVHVKARDHLLSRVDEGRDGVAQEAETADDRQGYPDDRLQMYVSPRTFLGLLRLLKDSI